MRKGFTVVEKPAQTKKAGIAPSLLQNDRLCAGLLRSRPWIAYNDEIRNSELRLSLGRRVPFSLDKKARILCGVGRFVGLRNEFE